MCLGVKNAPVNTVSGSTYYFMDCRVCVAIINNCSFPMIQNWASLGILKFSLWSGMCCWWFWELLLRNPWTVHFKNSLQNVFCIVHKWQCCYSLLWLLLLERCAKSWQCLTPESLQMFRQILLQWDTIIGNFRYSYDKEMLISQDTLWADMKKREKKRLLTPSFT